ncbi:MAG: aldehyde dehydrogenase family protein [Acidimicrobiales bacterium]|jgi:acyl-CoA reductase-like NAD-dependent aldehyde dehydrogenase
MEVCDKLYINGAWVPSTGTGSIEVVNAATEEVMGTVPKGTAEDVDRAARAAADAFSQWSKTSVDERSKTLARVQEALGARSADIATLISKEVGMPFTLSNLIQVGLPITSFATMSQIVREIAFEEEIGSSLVVREPIGVVGCITPWNYPLHQICAKVAPAIAAGCTVVLKPSVVAPLNVFVLAEVFDEIGLPPGVFNLVTGPGTVVGEAISSHPLIDMVSFTGSTRAGKRVMQLAADNVKRVALELGGKSANVILEDAELSKAVPSGVSACFLNSGQTCSALTRMIVPRSRLAEVEDLAVKAAQTYKPGDPFDPETRLGPLVSASQRERVRGYIKSGIDEGAKLLCGGAEVPEGLEKGYYVLPTVFSEVTNDMTIAQEEIFGPVLSIIPYDTEEEAIRIANDTIYGLAGGVWAGEKERAQEVARQLRTGQVEVNGGGFNPMAPFGGYKQSGIGRELGHYGLEEYLEVKAIQR